MVPLYSPMHPTLVPEPFQRPGWVYEEKVDGWRVVAYKDGAAWSEYRQRVPYRIVPGLW